MKQVLEVVLLLALVAATGYFWWEAGRPMCEKGLEYSLGTIAPEFALDQADLERASLEAAAVWNQELGQPVIEFDQESDFKISMIYDDRQALTDERSRFESALDLNRVGLNELIVDYRAAQSDYKQKKNTYDANRRSYQERQAEYNERVQAVNAAGGADPATASELEAERIYLAELFDQLEAERRSLNDFATELNESSQVVNNTVDEFNENVNEFNERFAEGDIFDQGIYHGKGIDIFQYENYEDLVALLVHEFGHSLGLDHIDNPEGVMYFMQHDEVESNLSLSDADRAELSRVCPTYQN